MDDRTGSHASHHGVCTKKYVRDKKTAQFFRLDSAKSAGPIQDGQVKSKCNEPTHATARNLTSCGFCPNDRSTCEFAILHHDT